jgi:hypothetical protein
MRATPKKAGPTSTTCSGCCEVRDRQGRSCRAGARNAAKPTRFGVIYFGSTSPAMDEALDAGGARASLDRCACAHFPFHDDVADFVAAHDQVFVVEQNRDAQLRTLLVNECGSTRRGWSRSCITTARRSPRASSRARSATARAHAQSRCRCTRWCHDLHRQAEIPPPEAAEERARLHAPRLRGVGLDAVRRLRARFDLAAIIQACFELDLEPHRVAKLSGIGCSSKTPTYFLGQSHGFNSVHGRMPSVLTGANLANRDLIYLGVSGDGDSASIGLGQFAH